VRRRNPEPRGHPRPRRLASGGPCASDASRAATCAGHSDSDPGDFHLDLQLDLTLDPDPQLDHHPHPPPPPPLHPHPQPRPPRPPSTAPSPSARPAAAKLARSVADAQVKRGDLELERGRYDAAAEEFQQALSNDSTLAVAWRGLGIAHLMRHDEEAARKAYEK